jgi:Ran GTPase-activating protein (RanGAP) involved in mRNA processing and transport
MNKLVQIVAKNSKLKELDLSWNELPPNEMCKLTEVLAKNRTLTYVNISWNFLTNTDAIKIVQSVKHEI